MKLNWLDLSIGHHLNGAVGKGLVCNKQALAQVIPFIIADEFPELSVLHIDKGMVVLQNTEGKRWKVCCAAGARFDLAPSFTKGAPRNKNGLTVDEYLESICDGVIFVNFEDATNLKLLVLDLESVDVREGGVVVFYE